MIFLTSLLTGWQSILARAAMVALIVGGLILFGWLKGHESAMAKFNAYRATEAQMAAVQVQRNVDLVKQQRASSARIEGNYESQIAYLRTRSTADWLRVRSADPYRLPALPKSAAGIATATADAVFTRQCAETTAQLDSLQEWVKAVP